MNVLWLLLKSYFIVGLALSIPYTIGFWKGRPNVEGHLPVRAFKMVTATIIIFLLVLAGYWMILVGKIYNHGRDMSEGFRDSHGEPEYEYTYAYTLDGVRAHEEAGWEHIPSSRADFVRDQRFHLRKKI